MRMFPIHILFAAFLFLGCQGQDKAKEEKAVDLRKDTLSSFEEFDASLPGSFSTQTAVKFQGEIIDSFFKNFPAFTIQNEVKEFYKQRNYSFAWFDENGITEQAEHLADRMLHLTKNGKPDTTLYYNELAMMMDTLIDKEYAPVTDIMLTSQYFFYSKRTYTSIITESQARNTQWLLPRNRINLVLSLDNAISSGKKIFENEPVHRQFTLLKKALIEFHKKGLDTIQTRINQHKSTYKQGDSHPNILLIKNRLHLLGDFPENNQSAEFDMALVKAVVAFQLRHGLKETGVADKSFFDALNVPWKERAIQMLVNLERFRWIPASLEGKYLFVNIPQFKLNAFDGDSLLWDMDVIVGQTARRTVIFNDKITYMAFSPFWNVPPGILRNSVLPAMRSNKNYLRNNNMEIVGYNGNTPRIRQRPGGSNPMGKVKFMFPNTFNIYLHDTPGKDLFDKTNRNLSAGCVRVSDAFFLAKYLLQGQEDWTEEKIKAAMNGTRERNVNLSQPMPVYIGYFTSFIDTEGNLNFRNDVYSRDKKLAGMLLK